eukprot:Gb_35361 [translate_table: standard]
MFRGRVERVDYMKHNVQATMDDQLLVSKGLGTSSSGVRFYHDSWMQLATRQNSLCCLGIPCGIILCKFDSCKHMVCYILRMYSIGFSYNLSPIDIRVFAIPSPNQVLQNPMASNLQSIHWRLDYGGPRRRIP